ncbi:MAG: hypothetical protein KGH84_01330, partial [Paracoccaceae bacterium]|nr:hypothetical protein [Paracoccaceae bacterium]
MSEYWRFRIKSFPYKMAAIFILVGVALDWMIGAIGLLSVALGTTVSGLWDRIEKGQNKLLLLYVAGACVFAIGGAARFLIGAIGT